MTKSTAEIGLFDAATSQTRALGGPAFILSGNGPVLEKHRTCVYNTGLAAIRMASLRDKLRQLGGIRQGGTVLKKAAMKGTNIE